MVSRTLRGFAGMGRLLWREVSCVIIFSTLATCSGWAMGAKPKVQTRQVSLMVRFEDGVTQARIGEIWAAERIERTTFLANLGLYVVRLPEGLEASAAVERLKKHPEVRHAEIDARAEPLEDK